MTTARASVLVLQLPRSAPPLPAPRRRRKRKPPRQQLCWGLLVGLASCWVAVSLVLPLVFQVRLAVLLEEIPVEQRQPSAQQQQLRQRLLPAAILGGGGGGAPTGSTNNKKRTTVCRTLPPPIPLPKFGGHLYRLGGVRFVGPPDASGASILVVVVAQNNNNSSSSNHYSENTNTSSISNMSNISNGTDHHQHHHNRNQNNNHHRFDMLRADFRGVFDRPFGSSVRIPVRSQPLWLVVYADEPPTVLYQTTVEVVDADADADAVPLGGDNDTVPCPAIASSTGTDEKDDDKDSEANAIAAAFDEPKRVPFFRRRRQQPQPPDGDPSRSVTVCVQLSLERLDRLAALAENYAGPVSAVVYVGYRSRGDARSEMDALARAWDDDNSDSSSNHYSALRRYVDLHLVIRPDRPWFVSGENMPNQPYPVNLLRQLSVEYATTEWVLVLEGDMITPVRGHDRLVATWDDLLRQEDEQSLSVVGVGGKKEKRVAFVVPLYNCPLPHDNLEQEPHLRELVPPTKADLAAAVADPARCVMRMGDLYWGHRGLNYSRWESLPPLPSNHQPFLTYNTTFTKTQKFHEPYFLIRKDRMPPYDVLFWSMPVDKATQVRDAIAAGFVFLVHPSLYAVHFSTDGILGQAWLPAKLNARFDFVKRMHNVTVQEQAAAAAAAAGTTW